MKFNFFIVIIFGIFFSSCSESDRYTTTQMWRMAQKVEPNIQLVPIPTHETDRRILCENYGEGCIKGSGRRLLVRRVELVAIEFETAELAEKQAQKINQWHAKNWLFDDVTNEPVLESFVQQAFDAVNPNLERSKKEP